MLGKRGNGRSADPPKSTSRLGHNTENPPPSGWVYHRFESRRSAYSGRISFESVSVQYFCCAGLPVKAWLRRRSRTRKTLRTIALKTIAFILEMSFRFPCPSIQNYPERLLCKAMRIIFCRRAGTLREHPQKMM